MRERIAVIFYQPAAYTLISPPIRSIRSQAPVVNLDCQPDPVFYPLLSRSLHAMMPSKNMELPCKDSSMAHPLKVKVSSRYQVTLPREARRRLNIQAGDHLKGPPQ